MNQKIIDGIINKIDIPNIIELLVERISFAELQSLLLKVFELKVGNKKERDLLHEYGTNRFTKPSDVDPVTHRNLELAIFSLLPSDFQVLDLSPLTPLGTTSSLTPVHQNNVVSTIRNTEVASDSTNILALECAARRSELLNSKYKSIEHIKLCSSQRVTRGQPFENKDFSPYFNTIVLCTAGRDQGNDLFEISSLEEHIRFYITIIDQLLDNEELKRVNVRLYTYEGSENARMIDTILSLFENQKRIQVMIEENSDFGKNYYSRLRFMIQVTNHKDQEFGYIDGGFTDWTAKLLSNNKERLLTSGIGTDYLLRTTKITRHD